MNIKEEIKQHLSQLAPHIAKREYAGLLRGAVAEIEQLESEINRIRKGAVGVHDALLHGFDDKTLLEMLTELYCQDDMFTSKTGEKNNEP